MNIYEQLKNDQREDGSFSDDYNHPSLLYTSFILLRLNYFPEDKKLEEMKRKAVEYILSKKNDSWQFSSSTALNFLALSALAKYNKDLIDGKALAHILMALGSIEVKEGGPYYPYMAGMDNGNKSIDLGANAAIAYFLSLLDVELPSLNDLLEKAIKENSFDSSFFDQSVVMYLVSLSNLGLKENNNEKDEEKLRSMNEKEEDMLNKILEMGEKRFSTLEEEIKGYALAEIKKTIKGNPDKQMSLMSYFMRKALGEKGEKFSDEFIAQLGLANIFFWTAFIIYDNFWDEDEEADPKILPVANLFARDFTTVFNSILPLELGFNEFFREIMDNLDAANTWETTHCRMKVEGTKVYVPEIIPDYGNFEQKYYPASAHILGPVAMLVKLGYAIDSSKVKNLIAYFKNYLIPKQINDDLHDWEEDLRRGNISTVVAMLLEDFGKDRKIIDLENDLAELQKIFWFKTLPKAGAIVLDFISKSQKYLAVMESLENRSPLEQYIFHEEKIIQEALSEQKATVDLLETYKGQS